MSDRLIVLPTAANFPGLYDVELPDGRVLRDVTRGQVIAIARQEGLNIGSRRQ